VERDLKIDVCISSFDLKRRREKKKRDLQNTLPKDSKEKKHLELEMPPL